MPRNLRGEERRRNATFGILSFSGAPYERLLDEWRWLEQLGFDSAWIPDGWSDDGFYGFETWTLLAALARTTSRLKIGSLITTVMPRHPSLLAASVMSVDHLSGGRVELGLGVGDQATDCDVFGLPRWAPGERVSRLEEQLRLLDQLLKGEQVTYEGKYYSVRGAKLTDPAQTPRPPLLVAAEGPRSLRLAARYADGWVTIGGQPENPWAGGTGERLSEGQALAATRERVERLERYRQESGKGEIRRMVLAYRRAVDPLSSLDAFDEFVGSYEEVGFDEFIFYWPPLESIRERRDILPRERRALERIVEARVDVGS